MIYAAACLPTWLERYADMIMEYNGMFVDALGFNRCWAFLHQCDNRYRNEHMPRMLRAAILKLERLVEESTTGHAKLVHELEDGRRVVFDPDSPFEYLWSLPETAWWTKEFEKKAQFIAMKLRDPEHWVQGTDSMVARSSYEHLSSQISHSLEGIGATSYNATKKDPKGKGAKGLTTKGGSDKDGKGKAAKTVKGADKYGGVRNSKAQRCNWYNEGKCQASKHGVVCPHDKTKLHTCSACAADHPVTECPQAAGNKNKKQKKEWHPHSGEIY